MRADALTQAELMRRLSYDPDTGIFIWLTGLRRGCIAGGFNNHNKSRVININGTKLYEHRLAFLYMLGRWPINDVDHINGIATDNRWSNLREATTSQNLANMGRASNNTSGFKGVSWNKDNDSWRAEITVQGKRFFLGYFYTPEEAHAAYCAAARKYFGEFARTA